MARTHARYRCYRRIQGCQPQSKQFEFHPLPALKKDVIVEKRHAEFRRKCRFLPTLAGFILIPDSKCAVSGASISLC